MCDLTRPEPAPEGDCPCAYELRITLANGGIDEIGAPGQAELRGYLRALLNQGLITADEQLRQLDVLLAIAQEREAQRETARP